MKALRLLFAAAALALSGAASAEDIRSEYTDIDMAKGCAPFAAADPEDGGDWMNMVCPGWRGWPVLAYYSDARESLFYGFPPDGDLAPDWESFGGFNSTATRIEWRIARDGALEVPFATIHRWYVADPDDDANPIQVLVVEKVGQIHERIGCAVGYVVATGNPGHNEEARAIADADARGFLCGEDEPAVVEGTVPLPLRAGG